MGVRVFEAVLAQPDSLARIRAQQRAIERVKGSVKLAPPTVAGLVLVTLVLPEPLTPANFFPDLPFYQV